MSMAPRCRWTMRRAMSRPRPVPSPMSLVVKNGSKMRPATSAGMPGPSSMTRTTTVSPARAGFDPHVAARRGVDGVVDQVRPHLVQLAAVALDGGQVARRRCSSTSTDFARAFDRSTVMVSDSPCPIAIGMQRRLLVHVGEPFTAATSVWMREAAVSISVASCRTARCADVVREHDADACSTPTAAASVSRSAGRSRTRASGSASTPSTSCASSQSSRASCRSASSSGDAARAPARCVAQRGDGCCLRVRQVERAEPPRRLVERVELGRRASWRCGPPPTPGCSARARGRRPGGRATPSSRRAARST